MARLGRGNNDRAERLRFRVVTGKGGKQIMSRTTLKVLLVIAGVIIIALTAILTAGGGMIGGMMACPM